MAITDIDWGTVTLTNGSTTVTGSGTSWIADDIRDGDTFVFVDGGDGFQQPIVASVQSNTELTLRNEWEGPTLTATAYTLRYQWDSSRVSAMSRRLILLLESGNLEALAGLTGPGIPVFNGLHSMEIRPETEFGDMFGPSSAVDDNIVVFNGATGKIVKDGGYTIAQTRDASNLNAGTLPDARVSATLSADKAFRRGNILGTVSQSGGVPTGAIIESGSNANGNYVRYANGVQMCWTTRTSTDVTAAEGALFRTSSALWTFPAAFSETPSAFAMEAGGAGGGWGSLGSSGTSTTATSWYIFRAASTTSTPLASLFAVGRWF